MAVLDSTDEEARRRANELQRSDLLTFAAAAPDQPALESVLRRLAGLTADDLGLVSASWCRPCVAEMPHLRSLRDDFHERGVEMLGSAVEGSNDADHSMTEPAKFMKWCTDHGVTWPQVLDGAPGGEGLAATIGIRGVPFLMLVEEGGRVIAAGSRAAVIRSALDRIVQPSVSRAR